MTDAQRAASDPTISAWVSASAGTGKTKLLVDRVLRLLLQGAEPQKILCITYTNAAAAEMKTRIQDRLRSWSVMDKALLREELLELTAKQPEDAMLDLAARLFITLMESAGAVRIETIHGLCGSILRRFPVEAGIPPHFTVLDARTEMELLAEARMSMFGQGDGSVPPEEQGDAEKLATALKMISDSLHEMSFAKLMKQVAHERLRLMPVLAARIQDVNAAIAAWCGVEDGSTDEALIEQFTQSSALDVVGLRQVAAAWEDNPKFSERGQTLSHYLREPGDRATLLQEYMGLFMSKHDKRVGEGDPYAQSSTWPKTHFKNASCDGWEVITTEQQRIAHYRDKRNRLRICRQSQALIYIMHALDVRYRAMKQRQGVLDNNDLIACTLQLFQDAGAAWVLYKLDAGLSHMLIDEAQDTSPAQWQLVGALCDEFYSGEGAAEEPRTVFVVGDPKQSIYRFQGADPSGFSDQQAGMAHQVRTAGQQWKGVALDRSFRTSGPVLSVVDAVFSDEELQQAVGADAPVHHAVHRASDAGHVELWPLLHVAKASRDASFEPLSNYPDMQTGQAMMAEYIADTIHAWLRDKRPLPAKGRAVQPDDIMILLRKRGVLAGALARALKRKGVPVSGMDRLQLTEHMAVQDLITLAQWLLLPEDDLALAGILKSPLCGLNEEQLFALAHNRGEETLWQRLQHNNAHPSVVARLQRWRDCLGSGSVYDFYACVLERDGMRAAFADHMGDEVHDPLDEFLSVTLHYEQLHTSELQGFVHWLGSGDHIVKRDMAQAQGAVRIMTIHGAKGLQAPVVILPDMVSTPTIAPQLLWARGEQQYELPLWVQGSKQDMVDTAVLRERNKAEEMAEYARQLYVAMTRAEDELYMGGWAGGNALNAACWYTRLQDAMEGMGGMAQQRPAAIAHAAHADETPMSWVVQAAQRIEPKQTQQQGEAVVPSLPTWFGKAVSSTETRVKVMSPSQLGGDQWEDASYTARSGVSNATDSDDAIQKGILVHQLLQYMPELPPEQRNAAAMTFLSMRGVSQSKASSMTQHVLALMQRPDLSALFGAGSMAEVAIGGLVDGVMLQGQIDRLVVADDHVHVVDYKTNARPPRSIAEVPRRYVAQMAAYVQLLEGVYADKTLKASLLWTETGELMALTQDALTQSAIARVG